MVALLAFTFVIRVGWAGWIAHDDPEAVRSPDTASYVESARAIVEDGRFNKGPDDDSPMFFRTPGYPMLLAGMLAVTGDSTWALSPLQGALSLLTVVLTFWLGRRVLAPGGAYLAAVVVALDPLQFALSGTVLSETAASLSLVVVAIAGWRVFSKPRESSDIAGFGLLGLAIAAATLIRPTTYYLPVLAAVFVAAATWTFGVRRVLVSLLAFAVPLVLLVGGWQVRNADRVDSRRFAAVDAYNLHCYRAAEVEARLDGISIDAARQQRGCFGPNNLAEASCPKWWNSDTRDKRKNGPCFDEMASRGIETLVENPVQTARMTVRGFVRVTLGPGTDTVGRYLGGTSSRVLTLVLGVWMLGLWVVFAIGGWVALRRHERRLFWAFVITCIAYVFVASSGADAYARMRTPVIPLIALVAGAAWPVLQQWTRTLTSGRASAGAGAPEGSPAAP